MSVEQSIRERQRRARFRWLLWTLAAFVLVAGGVWAGMGRVESARGPVQLWGHEFSVAEPRVFLLLLAFPVLLYWAGRSLANASPWQRTASLLLRVGFLSALVLALGQVTETERSSRLCTVALLDVSESVGQRALEGGRTRLHELRRAQRPGDSLTVLAFAADAALTSWTSGKSGDELPPVDVLRKSVRGGGTDVERALRSARAFQTSGCVKRTVVVSDGVETRGNAESVIAGLRGTTRVHSWGLVGEPDADMAVLDVALPQDVAVGKTFEVRVEVQATRESSGKLELYQGNVLNDLEPVRAIENLKGKSTLTFRSVARVAGPLVYKAVLRPNGSDRFLENNQASTRFDVPGPPRVLVVDGGSGGASHLARALSAQQFDVDVRAPNAFPAGGAELDSFAFVIVSDVSRGALGRNGEAALISFVRRGGGLLFAGGAAGYGPGGWQSSELAKILPVTMDDEKSRDTPGVALVLVIDRSGSMSGPPLEMAKEACAATLGVLEGNDLLEVIAFDSTPTRYVKMQPARYRARIAAEVRRIVPGGGTEFFPGLDMAYQDLTSVEARRKHIVLLTDGNANSEGLFDLANTALADGITITTVGLGSGVNEDLLRMIAEGGGGRFHLAPDAESLPRIFTRETEVVSKQAAVEDWFPVQAVASVDFLAGLPLGSAPLLRGYTRVQLKTAPAEAILVSERGDPILARQRHGLGFALAWTSDLQPRWAIDWLKWRHWGQFLGQLVRAHQRSDDETVLPMVTELWGDEVVARVSAFDANERFDSGYVSSLRALGPAGAVASEPTPFRLVAPGEYEARFRLPGFGSFAVVAEHRRLHGTALGAPEAVSRGSVSYPYAEEFRRLDADTVALARWARAGGGKSEPSVSELAQPGDDWVSHAESRTRPLVWAALVLFLLDLLVRRFRLPRRASRAVPK